MLNTFVLTHHELRARESVERSELSIKKPIIFLCNRRLTVKFVSKHRILEIFNKEKYDSDNYFCI